MTKEIQYALDCPFTSYWLKEALKKCLDRDPVDSVRDAEILFHLLKGWNEKLLENL
jgi:hypothetical protein